MKTDQPENVTFPMAKENKSNPHLLRIVLLITATLLVVFMLQMAIKTDLTHKVNVSLRWTVVTSLGVVGILVCLALFVITFTSSWQSHQTSLLHSLTFLHKLRYANILFLIILSSKNLPLFKPLQWIKGLTFISEFKIKARRIQYA